MPLSAGTRLGSFEILSVLGAGGMGEVYRARDTKLDREVAIKVLPDSLAGDPERLARLQREAKVLAALNHPNIAHIHGLEDSGGAPALVMELVEGPTLADRIAQGAMPVSEALPIARQIAEALEAAHEKGIIHRDLKPANIKITPDGHVKVLDFGLAKAIESDAVDIDLSHSPTMIKTGSMVGMLLGTAAYMSPEQAKGRTVDKRTDLFAFGCVLYEMLTGTPAFAGDDVTDILSAVLRMEPDWSRLPATVPPSVRHLLRLCLEKNAKNRRSDATDVRLDIQHALDAPPDIDGFPASRPPQRRAWIVATVSSVAAVVLGVALAVLCFRPGVTTGGEVTRVSVEPPLETSMDRAGASLGSAHPSISPDGRKVAFVVSTADGSRVLSLRDLSSIDAQIIPNTKGADRPFWSPDGRYVGFVANGQLVKIAVATAGTPETICPSPNNSGSTWNAAGVIAFSSQGSLYRVDARGGRPTLVKRQQGSDRYLYPQFLPDGRNILYTAVSSNEQSRGAFVAWLDTGTGKRVSDADYKVLYSGGYLLSLQNGDLFSQEFDVSRLTVSGEPRRLPDRVDYQYNGSRDAAIDASADGQLVYVSPLSTTEQLTWYDRSGLVTSTVGAVGEYRVPALAPDGRRLAFDRMAPTSDGRKIWVLDLETQTSTRITSNRSNDWAPLWSPDGRTLAFSSDRDGFTSIYLHSADGQGTDQLLLRADFDARAHSWSAPGIVLSGQGMQLLDPKNHNMAPLPNIGTFHAQFSPDGAFIAYDSNESGTSEVYVRRVPISSERWRVSSLEGIEPHWKADGHELYYLRPDGTLIAAEIQLEPQVHIGKEQVLFHTTYQNAFRTLRSTYVAAPDGSKFLFPDRGGKPGTGAMTVILNWPGILQH